jgi:hypothetical protein
MFVSTAVNLIFIPGMYILVQRLRRTGTIETQHAPSAEGAAASVAE